MRFLFSGLLFGFISNNNEVRLLTIFGCYITANIQIRRLDGTTKRKWHHRSQDGPWFPIHAPFYASFFAISNHYEVIDDFSSGSNFGFLIERKWRHHSNYWPWFDIAGSLKFFVYLIPFEWHRLYCFSWKCGIWGAKSFLRYEISHRCHPSKARPWPTPPRSVYRLRIQIRWPLSMLATSKKIIKKDILEMRLYCIYLSRLTWQSACNYMWHIGRAFGCN